MAQIVFKPIVYFFAKFCIFIPADALKRQLQQTAKQ
jgi:hypothetical protein